MKKYVVFIDDNIRFCEKITKNKPKSIFDDPYIGLLKKLHDKYGVSIQLNMFYEYENFNLSQMTDAYKQEWKDNASWLKMGFHSLAEFPDYPYVAVTYSQFEKEHDMVMNEIRRFAGEENITHSYGTHWNTLSDAAMQVLADKGVRMVGGTTGTPDTSPEIMSALSSEHRDRALLRNENVSAPFVACTSVNGLAGFPFVCNRNHLDEEKTEKYYGKQGCHVDEKTGLRMYCPAGLTLNAVKYTAIPKLTDELYDGYDFLSLLSHEQYFYTDYFAYEKDFGDKFDLAIGLLESKGCVNIPLDDCYKYFEQ